MSAWIQDPIVFQGRADFTPPVDLWAAARSELSADKFNQLSDLYGEDPLTPEGYVMFIEENR